MKIKDEKLPRGYRGRTILCEEKAFEADELRKERHEFSRAKRVRERRK